MCSSYHQYAGGSLHLYAKDPRNRELLFPIVLVELHSYLTKHGNTELLIHQYLLPTC